MDDAEMLLVMMMMREFPKIGDPNIVPQIVGSFL